MIENKVQITASEMNKGIHIDPTHIIHCHEIIYLKPLISNLNI